MQHEREEDVRLAIDAAQVGTFDWDVAHDRIVWSSWYDKLLSFAPGEFDGSYAAFARRVHPDDLAGLELELARCIAAHEPFRCAFRVVWPDGSVHQIWGCGELRYDALGKPGHMYGAAMELTQPTRDTAAVGAAWTARDGAAVLARRTEVAPDDEPLDAATRRAEAIVRRELEFSDAVLKSLPGVLYLYDQQGRFMRWNKNFERVTGYSAAEIATLHPLQLFKGPAQSLVAARIAEVFETGESSVDADFLAKDGTTTPYHFTGVKTLVDGRPCLIGVGVDVSERRRAEAERSVSDARYRTLFDYAPDGILIADANSCYLDANISASRMLGYSHDELVGLHASDIVVPEEHSEVSPALRQILADADYHREWMFRRKDGTVFPADVIATLMPDGDLLALLRDVTARKQAERSLRELNETLELKVADRTRELQAALVRAEAADRLKSAFLATMSHELRTPLNSIIGFTGIVLKGMAGPLTPEQHKQLGMVRTSARHLLELINDVLDLSKIEAEQLELRPSRFDLRAALEGVVATVVPLAEAKGLALRSVIDPGVGEVVSDRRRVEQIMLNLLNNAIKFTDHGGVTLTAEIVADAGGAQPAARLRVSDTGMGIKAEDLPLLFQPFRQLDTGITRRHDGTGLGLAICRRLAGLLGGEIVATSTWQRGSDLTVTLPVTERLRP